MRIHENTIKIKEHICEINILKKFLYLLISSIIFTSCINLPLSIDDKKYGDVFLDYSLFVYNDKRSTKNVSQIADLKNSEYEKVQNHFSPNFIEGNYYIIVEFNKQTSSPCILSFGPELFDKATLYCKDSSTNSWIKTDTNGRMVKNSDKKIVSWRTALLIPKNNNKVIIKIENQDSTSLQISIDSLKQFYSHTNKLSNIHKKSLSIMIFTSLFLLILCILKKDNYILNLFFISIFFMLYSITMKGIGATYIWNFATDILFFARLGYIAACSGLYFSLKIYFSTTEIHKNNRKTRIIFFVLALISICSIAIYGFMQDLQTAYIITIFILVIGCGLSILYGINATKKETFLKIQLIISWIPLFLYVIFRQSYHLLRLKIDIPFIDRIFENDYYFGYDICFLFNVIACIVYALLNIYKQYKEFNRKNEIEKIYRLIIDDFHPSLYKIKNSIAHYKETKDEKYLSFVSDNCKRLEYIYSCFTNLENVQNNNSLIKNEPVQILLVIEDILQKYSIFLNKKNISVKIESNFDKNQYFLIYPPFLMLLIDKLIVNLTEYINNFSSLKILLNYDYKSQKLNICLNILKIEGEIPLNSKENLSVFLIERITNLYNGNCNIYIKNKNELFIDLFVYVESIDNTNMYKTKDDNDEDLSLFEHNKQISNKILIIESNVSFLSHLLELLKDYDVCIVSSVAEAELKICNWKPEIIIQSIEKKENIFSFFDFCSNQTDLKHIPFIFLIDSKADNKIIKKIVNKNCSYFLKPFDSEDLLFKINQLLSMYNLVKNYYMYTLSNLLIQTPPAQTKVEKLSRSSLYEAKGLSKREIEIAELLLSGKETKEIADYLCISTNTVATHISHIYNKFEVNSKLQLFKILND